MRDTSVQSIWSWMEMLSRIPGMRKWSNRMQTRSGDAKLRENRGKDLVVNCVKSSRKVKATKLVWIWQV